MDREIKKLIEAERKRQSKTISLIASENYVSKSVSDALGSVFVNKYAEGYPKARYYAGNKVVDALEELAERRARRLFNLPSSRWDVNVQPYSGSPANLAVFHALLPEGSKIMAMALGMGGHLTHGSGVSITGKLWEQVPYGVDRLSEEIDYGELLHIALIERPKMIIAGGSAYSRVIDFKKMKMIADEIKALLFVDMSHFAGLVAGKAYPSPFPYADIVTATTHKTLRGPRSAIIFSRKEYTPAIRKAVFPGLQGGPHMNQIAAVAVALGEAATPSFSRYAKQVVKNARAFAEELQRLGWRIVSGGTDSHLFLVDVMSRGFSGGNASDRLEKIGVVINKNMIPFDERKPNDPSGIRIGTAAVTTRGMKEREMKIIARIVSRGILGKNPADAKKEVDVLCKKYPIGYNDR